jgi:outer membrane protein
MRLQVQLPKKYSYKKPLIGLPLSCMAAVNLYLENKMKLKIVILVCCMALLASPAPAEEAAPFSGKASKIGVVSFKSCLEESKVGQREQGEYDEMRREMEKAIEEKEKALNQMAPKFSEEYLDSLTPEAEKELKEKFRNLSQELSQQQSQYYQMLNQANYQIVHKMNELIASSAKTVAGRLGVDVVFNEEACFYFIPALNMTKEVVQEMDKAFEAESKESTPSLPGQSHEQ